MERNSNIDTEKFTVIRTMSHYDPSTAPMGMLSEDYLKLDRNSKNTIYSKSTHNSVEGGKGNMLVFRLGVNISTRFVVDSVSRGL